MRFIARLLAPLFILSCALSAHADVVSDFQNTLSKTQSMQGSFVQTVVNRSGKKQVSSGDFAIFRPGKFRWHYSKPYEQLIISDAKDIWLFDPDLNQVTVKSMDHALDASPAALLSGDNQIGKRYMLTALPPRENLSWIEAIPKQNDSNFNRVRLGFANDEIRAMELEDSFGQAIRIDLKLSAINGKLDAALFQFTPPKGADVVRQ